VILPAASAIRQAAGFMIMASKGFQAAYPEADPATVLTPEAVAASSIADEACAGAVIGQFAGTSTTIVARNPSETPPWPELLRASSAGNRFAGAPLLVVQGAADPLVVQPLTDAWVAKACAFGDVVDYRIYDGADHGTVIGAAREDVLRFFETRANRGASTDTCPLETP